MNRFSLCSAVVFAVFSSCSVDTYSSGPNGTSSSHYSSTKPSSDIGGTCTTDYDCAGATGFCAGNIPGGYCTMDCTDTTCPSGSLCVHLKTTYFCAPSCPVGNSSSGCRTGAMCQPLNNRSDGYCL